jgi:putative tryptophan/tyrosine transport system substrate-binding protein
MRRREAIALLGSAAAWPLVARAQHPGHVRRIGVLMATVQSDPDAQARLAVLRQALQELGWSDGRNVLVDYRWAGTDPDRMLAYAAELVGLTPDVILAHSPPGIMAAQRQTRTVPLVFVMVPAPVEIGLVASLTRPGGNITGLTHFETAMAGKWLEILREISPGVTRVAFLLHPQHPAWAGYASTIEAAASSFGIGISPAGARDAVGIERALEAFAREPNGGLMVLPDNFTQVHRELIIALAARNRLPAIYPFQYFAADGGLISYGVDTIDVFRRAATYIDRILRGANPGELPVQTPVKFELVVNLKTATALGIKIPETFLLRADEVIE